MPQLPIRLQPALVALTLMLSLTACNRQPSDEHRKTQPQQAIPQAETKAPAPVEAAVLAVATQASTSVKTLQARTDLLVAQPDAASLKSAQAAWRAAHLAYREYQQTRILAGIQRKAGDADIIDATPMLPGYLDSVPGYPTSGLIHAGTPLTAAYLRQEHQSTDLYFLTLGFHPLAFMLFGTPADSNSTRQASDFVSPAQLPSDHIDSATRRRKLVTVMTAELVKSVLTGCNDPQVQQVTAGMQTTLGDSDRFRQHLAAWLNNEIAAPLEAWEAYPSGEDNDGVPVSHTTRPGVDFQEWQAMLKSVTSRWIPLTEPDGQPALQAEVNALQDAIKPLTLPPYPPTPKAVSAALNQVRQAARQWAQPAQATPPAP